MKLKTMLATLIMMVVVGFSGSSSAADKMPDGSYLESCINCSLSNDVLSCWCRSSKHEPQVSRVQYASQCVYVENLQGRLACTHGRLQKLPPGSYQTVCKDCSYDGSQLGCICRATTGYFWQKARLKTADRCQNDIVFSDEGLACSNSPLPARFAELNKTTDTASIAAANTTPLNVKATSTAPTAVKKKSSLFSWFTFGKSTPKVVTQTQPVKPAPEVVVLKRSAIPAGNLTRPVIQPQQEKPKQKLSDALSNAPIATVVKPAVQKKPASKPIAVNDEWQPLTAFHAPEPTKIKTEPQPAKAVDDMSNTLVDDLQKKVENTKHLPMGSYQQSCLNCLYKDNRLACLCPDQGKRLRITKLPDPERCTEISNTNGTLRCIL